MKFEIKHWILIAFGIVFIYFAVQSFRSENWGVFVIDIGLVSIAGWYLYEQLRGNTGDEEKSNSNGVESPKRRTKGQ